MARTAPLATDQRGAPRLSPCDIGSFEVQPTAAGNPSGPPGGNAGTGSSSASTPPRIAKLRGLKLTPKKVRNGRKAKLRFEIDLASQIGFALQRKLPGVKSGRRCLRATAGPQPKGKACVRLVPVGGAPAAFAAPAGVSQRDWKPRGLAPGRYRLTATPAGGAPSGIGLTVMAKPRRRSGQPIPSVQPRCCGRTR